MKCLPQITKGRNDNMRLIHTWYNIQNNYVDINAYNGYIHCIDALELDNPREYTKLVLKGEMTTWANTQDGD